MLDFISNIYRQVVSEIAAWGENPAVLAALYSAIELAVCALMLVREIVNPSKKVSADAEHAPIS